MKVCIDGMIQEVADNLEDIQRDITPSVSVESKISRLEEGFAKLQTLVEPLAKLLSQSKEN